MLPKSTRVTACEGASVCRKPQRPWARAAIQALSCPVWWLPALGWGALVVCLAATEKAMGEGTNRVLHLNGAGEYVELPSGILDSLTEATVEAWVRWDSLEGQPKRVFNYGAPRNDMSVGSYGQNGSLWFVVADPGAAGLSEIITPPILRAHDWRHIAAVSGSGGMRLYFDGWLLATNAHTGSFAGLKKGGRFFLGERVTDADPPVAFQGDIDEVRVWSRALSGEEIRAAMTSPLSGNEPGLVGLWNFDGDDGSVVTDRTSGRHDGRIIGGQTIQGAFPRIAVPVLPISGIVAGADATPQSGAVVVVTDGGRVRNIVTTNRKGEYAALVRVSGDSTVFAFYQGRMASNQIVIGNGRLLQPPLVLRSRLPAITNLARLLGQAVLGRASRGAAPLVEGVAEGALSGGELALACGLLGDAQVDSAEVSGALISALAVPEIAYSARESLKKMRIPPEAREVLETRARAMGFLFSGLLLPFVAFHLFLFIFFPQARSNLYYAIFVLTAAIPNIISVFQPDIKLTTAGPVAVGMVTALLVAVSGLRFLYSMFYPRPPFWYWPMAVLGIVGSGFLAFRLGAIFAQLRGLFTEAHATMSNQLALEVIGLVMVGALIAVEWGEIVRVLLTALVLRRKGAWVLGLGMLFILLSVLVPAFFSGSMMLGYKLSMIPADYLPNLGVAGFVGCTSAYLAANFAQVSRSLAAAKQEIELKHQELQATNGELRSAQQVLEVARRDADEANLAKSQFLANVSHELRTPLNAIIGYSEMLQEEAPEIESVAMVPDLQKIHAAARHQLGLINDILDLAKIEAGRMSLTFEDVDIPRLVNEVVATAMPLAAKNGNQIIVECPSIVPQLHTDPTKLRQVLLNLLSNACKFTVKGVVAVTVEAACQPPVLSDHGVASPPVVDDSRLVFRVHDTGIGMTPEQMGRLFQPFVQAEAATSRRFGGTGLGLALSRRFCEMMGGRIEVESDFGKGSVFTVILPLPRKTGAGQLLEQP